MSRIGTVLAIGTSLAAMATLGVGQASADPSQAPYARDVTANCGGVQVEMVTNGGGWHSGHVVGSTAVFIPLADEESGVFTDPAGGAHPFSRPLTFKGSADPSGHPIVGCTFSVDTTFPDSSRLVVTGRLIGFFT